MGLSFLERHSKVFWDTDKKRENDVKERQEIVNAYNNGFSLPSILDNASQEPKWQDAEEGYGTMVFTNCIGKPIRAERPCVDNSILFVDPSTKEAVAITYNKEEFENSMESYWCF